MAPWVVVSAPWIEPARLLAIQYPTLPPSANHIYYNRPGGGRGKTAEAQAWENRFIAAVSQHHLFTIRSIQDHADLGAVFGFDITLLMTPKELLNQGWLSRYKKDTWIGKIGTPARRLKLAGQRKAETRYKKIDVTNRFKLVEDAMAAALGIDDSNTFVVGGKKMVFSDQPGVFVTVSIDDPRAFGVPEGFLGPP